MCGGKVKYYICDGRTFRESHPKPDSMPILMADQMPRYDFGVGIYGGYWPDGIAVKNPYCKANNLDNVIVRCWEIVLTKIALSDTRGTTILYLIKINYL